MMALQTSTHKTATCAAPRLADILETSAYGHHPVLLAALDRAVPHDAQRGHPKRDRRPRRLRLGLRPMLDAP